MANILPDLNYLTKLSIDDYAAQSLSNENETLNRFKISFGDKSGIENRHGVIDQINPKNLVETDVNRPLLVSRSTVDNLRISVSVGAVICPNGAVVQLASEIFDTQLIRTNLDDVLVVFLENELISYGESRVSKYNVPGKVRTIQNPDCMRSVLLTDFNNSSIFPTSRKESLVVISVIKVVSSSSTASGLDLSIDYTNTTYSFNRPWFSIVDSEHRASKGSGLVTDQNPHGMSINDFSTGSIPFYSQFLPYGKILAKDYDIKGRPGYACVETISNYSILTDVDGSITKKSRFGGIVGTKYFLLAAYPASVNSFHLQTHKSRSLAFDWIVGTNIIVLPIPEVFTAPAVVYYNRVHAAEPSTSVLANRVTFDSVDDTREIAITGGFGVTSSTANYIDFEGSGPVARNFKVYLNASSEYIKFPQILQNTILLDSIGTEFVSLDVNQFGPSQLSLALVNAVASSNLKVTVRIYGTNLQNAVITEDLTFDSTWQSFILPAVEDLSNLKKTDSVFQTITGYQVIERESDGASSKIIVYAEIESGVAEGLNDLLKVSEIQWNGVSVSDVFDCREFNAFLSGYKNKYSEIANNRAIDQTLLEVATEDFSCPAFNEVVSGYSDYTYATNIITFSDDVTVGDTVTIAPAKTLTAVSGTPNRSVGQFKVGTASETRDDAILTVNNVAFNSGYVASAESTNGMKLTNKTAGVRGNNDVTIVTTITQAITADGDVVGGYDNFAEAVYPQHRSKLNTKIYPNTEYNTALIRDRYLSRAFPIKYASTLKIFVYGAKTYQIRYRLAQDELNFTEWITLAQTANNTYTIAKPNITKIQLEIFGECTGYSLFEG